MLQAEAVTVEIVVVVAQPREQVRMVAHLEQGREGGEGVGAPLQHLLHEVGAQEALIHVTLLLGELAEEHLLRLAREWQLHVDLGAPKQVRPDEVAQHKRALKGGLHLEVGGVGVCALADGQRELLLEHGQRAQLARVHKVEE